MIPINELTPDQVRSLARIKQVGGDRIFEVMNFLIAEGKQSLVRADEMARIHRLQGRVEAFQDLLAAIEDAAEIDSRQ